MKKSRILSVAAAAALTGSLLAMAPAARAEEEYHAYIGIQSASFTFRNAWNEAQYGQGITSDEGWAYFDTLTGWDGPTAVDKGGNFTDATITGDGTYSVKLDGDFDFGSDETLNLLFVSTDIPQDTGATITDVEIIFDGSTKYTFDEAYLSPDENTYLQPMAINIWNDDLGKSDGLFGYVMPSDSVEIKFTVNGLGDGAAAAEEEAPAEEVVEEVVEEAAPAADSTTTTASTGNASAVAVGAVMAAAAVAAVSSKKRK